MTITLRPETVALIRASVARGEFSSPEELVEQAVEHFLGDTPEEIAEMRQTVDQALQEPGGQPAHEAFTELRAKYSIPR